MRLSNRWNNNDGKTMKGWKLLFLLVVGWVLGGRITLAAQEGSDLLSSYTRNFLKSSSSTRIELIQSALADPRLASQVGPLCDFVLSFSLQYSDLLRDDPEQIALTTMVAQRIGDTGYVQAVQNLWRVFMVYRDTKARVAILSSLAKLGRGDSRIIENLNQFLTNQNNLFRSGMDVDYEILSASIAALGALGDGSSFPVLFSTMMTAYPEEYKKQAVQALGMIKGDYKKYLIDVIKKNPPLEKLAALNIAQERPSFVPADLGEIAEAALEVALSLYPVDPEEQRAVQDLRYRSVQIIRDNKWSRASTLVRKHFYQVQGDYAKKPEEKAHFIDAIACLGVMGSSEAASALSLHLGLINSTMERTGQFDREVLEAIINALGELGDKVAFDYLLYVGYLPYPADIKTLARNAMNRLRW
ncbi:MAG: hypothetical protein N2509_04845 [Treponemataceae bacterium]|nr:hypothetical protein [Treponemataceae bacterium]